MLCIFFAYVTHIASDVYCVFLCVCCAYSLHIFFAYVTHHPCVWYAYSSHTLRIILVYGIYPYSSHMLCVWYMHYLHMLVLCIILVYDMRILHACCVYSSHTLRIILAYNNLCVFFAYVAHHPCVWYVYSSCMLRHGYAYPRIHVCYACSSRMLCVSAPRLGGGGVFFAYSSGGRGGGCIPILELFYKIFLRCTFEMLIRTLIYISPKILVEHGVSIKYLLLLTLIMSFLEAMWRPWICWITK